ncbi:MAE_28990/MAE_18760 family HEPN-like nuclease [Acuticoccus kandeliae]|uniref:MAE_28990/MAE_18760 family HEPN-like nuclease n=1 Tax=Acuticoccus kandeliae TaxID=2073160 RepID=UPI000D3E9CFB|nr:MAE_28990/MAE_18760 family HEPN-like nuclease [Acuticoccus kandeliae]
MSKPYTETDFSVQITEGRNWRIREISDLKLAIRRGDENLQRVLLRALVTISYAHWEGYIRYSARKYLEHVALRRMRYGELDRQFLKNYCLPRLSALAVSQKSILERCRILDEILNSPDLRFIHVNYDLINTKSNLTFDVFSDICLICGIDGTHFERKSSFINIVLLKRRNEIAHGEDTLVSKSDLDQIADETIGLMRAFGDALENSVILKTYKLA